jgi:hypothetical protein
LPTETAQHNAALRQYTSQARSPFWLLKSTSWHIRMRVCYLDCWTVLLPSDTHIKPVISIHYSCFTSICDLFADYPS